LNYDIGTKLYPNDNTTNNPLEITKPNQNLILEEKLKYINNLKIIKRLLNLILADTKYYIELKLNKFFEYILWKKINISDIVIILSKKLNINIDSNENLEQSKNSIGKYLEIIKDRIVIFKCYNHDEIYKKIIKLLLCKIIKLKGDNITHTYQQLPDPVKGRPRLDWGFCQYDGCKKSFSNCSALVTHLIECNVYTRGYHTSHEQAVNYNSLTEDKILNLNTTKCPSWMCETKNFASAQELIQHLQLLGIKPFWKTGMTFCVESSKKKILEIEPDKKYFNDTCVLCLDNPGEIIINNCGHQVYCVECVKKANKINCPICRGKVDLFLPYA
jgi:hypothetical protein